MTVYFGLWKINPNAPFPPDTKSMVALSERFLAMYHEDVKSGVIKEIHEFLSGGSGYFITGDVGAGQLHEALYRWNPYVNFEVHETVKFPKPLELQLAMAKRAASQ